VAGLAQPAHSLDPAKGLFNHLAPLEAHRISDILQTYYQSIFINTEILNTLFNPIQSTPTPLIELAVHVRIFCIN
jgi:hypothetical protein